MSNKNLRPRLRFYDFKYTEWIPLKLENVARFSKGKGYSKNDLLENGSPIILYGRMYTNYETIIREVDTYTNPQKNTVYSKGTEVIVPSSGETAEEIARASYVSQKGIILAGDLNIMHLIEEHSPLFLTLSISNGDRKKELIKRVQGSSVVHLYNSDLRNVIVYFPELTEQNKIGLFFEQIDKMIQLQQSKVNKVKDLKSAYLSEMFPKEGEKYPKKRFEGFTEPWKKYNLGEIGYTISGVGFPNSEQGGKKGIMFLKVSDMNLSENTTEINTSNNFVTAFQVHKRNWKVIEEVPALIFAKVGAALLLDRKRLVNDKFLIDNNMMAYILGEKLVADFTNALFKKIYLPKYAQIGALPSMNDSIVEKIEVLIPSLEEQEKIGKFFKNLDNQIYIEEEKLTKLEKLKQAYLNDMFV